MLTKKPYLLYGEFFSYNKCLICLPEKVKVYGKQITLTKNRICYPTFSHTISERNLLARKDQSTDT
jgi:hypothetical protein